MPEPAISIGETTPPSATAVVLTISRQIGSGGAYIGQAVARRLAFEYVDRQLLTRAAAALNVDDERSLEQLEERANSMWRPIARALFAGAPDAPFVPPPPPSIREGDVLEAETRIIREIAAAGRAVIVGRGAAHVLGDHPGVLRLFVHAPAKVRMEALQRLYSLGAAEAKQMVEQSDRNRARFVQSLTGRLWSDACLYDLTIDTSVVPMDEAADLVTSIMQRRVAAAHRGTA